MSLRKRPTLTPKLLAANAANAKKSTGPRRERGKYFSALNGWKGGRPINPANLPPGYDPAAGWSTPDMTDPECVKWILTGLRDEFPDGFAIMIQYHPEYRYLIEPTRDLQHARGPQKKPRRAN